MNIPAYYFASILFLGLFLRDAKAQQIVSELTVVRDSSLPLEERVEAAKRCINDGPLNPNVMEVLFANIDVTRPRSLDSGDEQMTPFYTHPFWALLVDKGESLSQFVDGAFNETFDAPKRALYGSALIQLKERGHDATSLIRKVSGKSQNPKTQISANLLISQITETGVASPLPMPEYRKPPPEPTPMDKLIAERVASRAKSARTNAVLPNQTLPLAKAEQPGVTPVAKMTSSREKPNESTWWPWVICGIGVLVVCLATLRRVANSRKT